MLSGEAHPEGQKPGNLRNTNSKFDLLYVNMVCGTVFVVCVLHIEYRHMQIS